MPFSPGPPCSGAWTYPSAAEGATHASHGLASKGQPRTGGSARHARLAQLSGQKLTHPPLVLGLREGVQIDMTCPFDGPELLGLGGGAENGARLLQSRAP